MKQNIRQVVVDGGTRLITEKIHNALSVSLGVWIETGARHEDRHESGISHFTEHLLFKGTKTRTAREIALTLESIGGSLDAFTGREYTCYYAQVLKEHMGQAVRVLADMLKNSLFRRDHVTREREVVLEEIKTYEDTPEELIHDIFAGELWRGHPLGNPILGSVRTVRGFRPGAVRDYFRRRYTADRIVVAAAGAIDHEEVRRLVEKSFRFEARDSEESAVAKPRFEPTVKVVRRKLSQEYLCIGGEGLPIRSEERHALALLTTILGGGMSSRLFQRIREEKGLAYTIYSYTDSYEDSGLVTTFAATVPERAAEVVELVLREYRKILREGIRRDELASAKSQLRGETIFSLESVSSRMRMLAGAAIYGQEFLPVPEHLRRISRTTRDQLMAVAARLLDPERLSLVAMGPVSPRTLRRVFPGG